MTTADTIRNFDIFEGLNEEQLGVIAGLTDSCTLEDGEPLFQEKEVAKHIYILLKGKVRIQVQLTSKPETIAIAILAQPGSLIGWSGLAPEQYYTASAICMEETELLAIPGEELMAALESDCDLGFKVIRKISEVISSRLRNIQSIVLKTL